MKTLASNEMPQSHMYNSLGSTSINYTTLQDTKKMVAIGDNEIGTSDGLKNSYRALNHFVRGVVFYQTTMRLGDVPCSDALKGDAGNFWPKYDTQEKVFEAIIFEFDEAAKLFKNGERFSGDPVYNGNVALWEKASNGYLLRVLIQLSTKKTQVGAINIKTKFEEVAARSLFAGFNEDFQRVYNNKAKQYYPYHRLNHNYNQYMYLQKTLIDMLKKYNDYRLFYYAEPASSLVAANPANTFGAYAGVDGTMQFKNVEDAIKTQGISALNKRYFEDPGCEPVKKLSYAEVNFILAEAALKGWTTPKSAQEHYENGVRAAMQFTTNFTAANYRHGVTIDATYITNYLGNTSPANFNNSDNKLELIMEQKYLAGFMQTSWNSYFDYRRTGYPVLPINPASSQNTDAPTKMPVRWTYPGVEISNNANNVNEAIKRQFGSASQTQNDVMWLLK